VLTIYHLCFSQTEQCHHKTNWIPTTIWHKTAESCRYLATHQCCQFQHNIRPVTQVLHCKHVRVQSAKDTLQTTIQNNFSSLGNCQVRVWYHSLTPWCRTLFEKLIVTQLVKKILSYGTRRFITTLTKVRHCTLSRASWIQFAPSILISLRSILTLSSHLRLGLPSGLFLSGLPTKALWAPLPTSMHTAAWIMWYWYWHSELPDNPNRSHSFCSAGRNDSARVER